jgi:hypothetical protein
MEVLRLLAPQRGLFAIGQNKNQGNIHVRSIAKVFILVIPASLAARQAKAGIQFLLDSGSPVLDTGPE